jgi:hypothetical protein
MDNWQIDNFKKAQIYQSIILTGIVIMVGSSLFYLSNGVPTKWKFIIFLLPLVFIFLQGIFSKLEATKVAMNNNVLYVYKKSIWKPRKKIEAYITEGALKEVELANTKSIFRSKLILHYLENNIQKVIEIHLKNFSIENRNRLSEKLLFLNKA